MFSVPGNKSSIDVIFMLELDGASVSSYSVGTGAESLATSILDENDGD